MIEKYKYIEDLLERFFEGETSKKEEQELYSFFKGDAVPEYMQAYKPVFEYLETGIIKDASEQKSVVGSPAKKTLSNRWRIGISIAASVLILLVLTPLFVRKDMPFDPYEGSYMVKNGVKIYDVDAIKSEQSDIEYKMEQKQKEIEGLMSIVDKY